MRGMRFDEGNLEDLLVRMIPKYGMPWELHSTHPNELMRACLDDSFRPRSRIRDFVKLTL